MKKDDTILLVKKYKRQILQYTALAVTVMCACGISYMAGRYSVRQKAPADAGSGDGTAEATSQYTDLAPGSPSFLFPPGAAFREATPSNVDIMDSQVLNLAYLYEDGADSTDPADSYGGRLYDMLALKDAAWLSGLYDLYNYTPQQLASLLGLPETAVTSPSGIIPEFRNLSVRFVNSGLQENGGTSNAREIISIINTLHYYGVLKDMKTMEDCADKLWNASHKYSVSIGGIYYCDGSCLDEVIKVAPDTDETGADQSGTEGVGEAAVGAKDVSTAAAGAEDEGAAAAGAEDEGTAAAGAEGAGETAADPEKTSGPLAEPEHPEPSSLPPQTAALGGQEGDTGNTAEAAAAVSSDIESPGDGPPDTASSQSETSETALSADSRTCPGHVDCTVLAVIKGTAEADSLFQAAASLEAVKTSGWTGWNADTMNMTGVLLAQDWFQEYGLYTVDYPVKGILNAREIEQYMGLVPKDASQQRKDFVRYALTSVGKIPYYWGGKPSAPGYTGNRFGSLTAPDEDGRILKGLDCSGWINWVYWSVTGRGLGAQSTLTLLGSGTPVSRDELLPGDICIRSNPMAHVVIFLGWTPEGNMLCIQETTGNSNNVEVGTVTSDWESYRRILE